MAVQIGLINDTEDAKRLAATLFGDSVLVPVADTDLASAAASDDSHVYAGSYGSLAVVSCSLFATVKPSSLTKTIATMRESPATTLLFTNPAESIGVFARWENGELRRSLAANPVDLYEDIGLPFVFEGPFWGGDHPLRYAPGVAPEPLALPFHPQQLAEQANREWLGFRYTHPLAATDYDPSRIPVTAFAIHPAGYEVTEADLDDYRRNSARTRAVPVAMPPIPGPVPSTAPTEASTAPPAPLTAPVDASTAPEPADAAPKKRGRFARYFGFGAKKEQAASEPPTESPTPNEPPTAPEPTSTAPEPTPTAPTEPSTAPDEASTAPEPTSTAPEPTPTAPTEPSSEPEVRPDAPADPDTPDDRPTTSSS